MTVRNPTFRSGRMRVDFDHIETRDVLAGAYRGRDISERTLLTHLVFVNAAGVDLRTGCSVPIDSIVDTYGVHSSELRARPTCPTCAPKYDKLLAEHGASILEPEEPMRPNRAPRLHHGRADQLTRRVYWQESGEGDWTNITLGLRDAEDARYLGPINLEDAQHAVFRLADGRTVAQVADMHRNGSSGAVRQILAALAVYGSGRRVRITDLRQDVPGLGRAEFDEAIKELDREALVSLMRNDNNAQITAADQRDAVYIAGNPRHLVYYTPNQESDMHRNHKGLLRRNALRLHRGLRLINTEHPEWGTWVVLDQARSGIWEIRGDSGTRLLYEHELGEWALARHHSNAPPPPPRRRRTADPSLRRVRQITEEHERREKPFDPSIGYERGTKSHHFALNPAEWQPYRLPDEEVDLHWAVWYGPDGAEGDVATEVELDGHRGFVVREYQNVDGLIEEYDESEPFLVTETFVDEDQLIDAAFESTNSELSEAMNESDDPDEPHLTIVPDNDEARLLIMRYAAAIGVRYLSEHGGEESWAAELPR